MLFLLFGRGALIFFCYWGEGVYWFAVWAGRRGLGAGACFLMLERWMCGFAVEARVAAVEETRLGGCWAGAILEAWAALGHV